jgi:hypothetical protein
MFCDQCGAALVAGQQYCSRCGKEIIGPIEAGYIRRSRVRDHIRLLGILWIAYSAFNMLAGVALVIVANTVLGHFGRFAGPGASPNTAWLQPFLSIIAGLVLLKAAVGFFSGWGLLQHEPWARVLSLVLGFIVLITNIPIGTALGVYTLWVLLPAQSDEDYHQLAQARAAA